jgi:regulatory protein
MTKQQRRPPTRMTEAKLADAALFYLSRYASSSGNLRQVLTRKLLRSAHHYDDDPEPLIPVIDAIVARHLKSGAVNDSAYAEAQVRKLRRRGGSARIIGQRLIAKGVPGEIIAEASAGFNQTREDRAAAIIFARRRRLGPFRNGPRTEHRLRDLAAMGRGGFAYAIATQVIDAIDPNDIEQLFADD